MTTELVLRLRRSAEERVEIYELRYSGDPCSIALTTAKQWLAALSSDPPDIDAIATLARRHEELQMRRDADVAFFTFCNHMAAAFHEIWEDHLRSGGR